MTEKTIIEASIPNAGRVYDYMLGGHHNFEIDRHAGDHLKGIMPFLPKVMRLMRWCLQDMGSTLTVERGYDTIIDFASGLPTVDHLHTSVAPGTTLILSDRDPVCVEYGREILGDTPNVHYFLADCRKPEVLLEHPEVQRILNGNRHVAFVCWGVSMYLSDAEIAHMARVLYDWSSSDSCLAFYMQPESEAIEGSASGAQVLQAYRQMGEELHYRSVETFQQLVSPWVADSLGYRTMQDWLGMAARLDDEVDRQSWPGGVSGYGVYLVKR
jgi:hypothetical protein